MTEEQFLEKAYIYATGYSTHNKTSLKEYLIFRSEFRNNVELSTRYRKFVDAHFKGIRL